MPPWQVIGGDCESPEKIRPAVGLCTGGVKKEFRTWSRQVPCIGFSEFIERKSGARGKLVQLVHGLNGLGGPVVHGTEDKCLRKSPGSTNLMWFLLRVGSEKMENL